MSWRGCPFDNPLLLKHPRSSMKCFSNPGYFVPLPKDHPFPVEKYPDTLRLLQASSVADQLAFLSAPKATMEEILAVHEPDYVDAVLKGTLSPYARNRLGLPHHPRWIERSLLDVGGTIAAADAALQEGAAWNLGGGTHHAMPGEGLGFCVLNDVAVAVVAMRRRHPDLQMLVIDTDAHQGNGTHRILRGMPGVFTFSIHVAANYPAQKEAGDLDVGLPRYVSGEAYLSGLEYALQTINAQFQPDLIFWVSGVDVLKGDKFGQMHLTTGDLAKRDEQVLQAAIDWEASLVGTLGGGYPMQRSQLAWRHAECVLRTFDRLG